LALVQAVVQHRAFRLYQFAGCAGPDALWADAPAIGQPCESRAADSDAVCCLAHFAGDFCVARCTPERLLGLTGCEVLWLDASPCRWLQLADVNVDTASHHSSELPMVPAATDEQLRCCP
jgi:hypothetical protein